MKLGKEMYERKENKKLHIKNKMLISKAFDNVYLCLYTTISELKHGNVLIGKSNP